MKRKAQSSKLKGRTKRAQLSFLPRVGFPSLAPRAADNSPALQCWAGRGGELRACLKTRPVRVPGLQRTGCSANSCRPRALTRRSPRVFKHALSPGRDGRNVAPTPRSSLPGLSDSPTAHPALKCWAIFGRPCGTAFTRTDCCKKLRCARTKLQPPRAARRESGVYVFPREREPSLQPPRCRRTPKRPEGRAPAPRARPASAFTLNACSLNLPLRACLKTRPVRAPGLQMTGFSAQTCSALTRRFPGVFKHALNFELYPLSFFPPAPGFPRLRTTTPNHL